ncbi:MAG: hypothetical protein OFPII_01080 [Osedax symbiont Rs1]|nr:MAG: hypothetical protein OFPII_01080 [Osedax symbiont Rs1]
MPNIQVLTAYRAKSTSDNSNITHLSPAILIATDLAARSRID